MHIELPILDSIKDSQSQHGLKYENYRNYRSYCSRKLHRLRRSLNVRQGIQSSAKARHQRAKKLYDVNNTMVLEAGEKEPEYAERMLVIPLYLAERAWAYAMQLKQEAEQPRKRFHLIRRLKKASEHAQRFEKLCHDPESPCSDRTKAEATAYASYITGLYKLEREDWKEAKENLYRALTIYSSLRVSLRKVDALEHYQQRIDELRASLRYCMFSLGDQAVKDSKVKLPETLQFHDIAFRHALQVQQEAQMNKEELAREKAAKKTGSVRPTTAAKAATTNTAAPQQAAEEQEEEEEEFEETQEGMEVDEESDDDSDESDDDEQPQASGGGVTGLVKGWLGGAWSK